MKVLVIGSGGREHALVWKIAQSKKVEKIFCAPGNPGTGSLAENIPIKVNQLKKLLLFAKKEKIDLTIVGPENPLILGIADLFAKNNVPLIGPSKKASRLEGSKIFAKKLMKKYGIPTAKFEVFTVFSRAKKYLSEQKYPLVIKADGQCLGKGVAVCRKEFEAQKFLKSLMKDKVFGKSGSRVIIEEYLIGQEISFMAATDGINYVSFLPSRDHKRVFDGDRGPNTGGIGAYAPVKFVDDKLIKKIEKEIVQATLIAMKREGCPYSGILYPGLILTAEGPKVLEFNCRFGDPETQPLMTLMTTDIIDIFEAIVKKKVKNLRVKWSNASSVCVVLTAQGYPGNYEKGKIIFGLPKPFARGGLVNAVMTFHSGTKILNGKLVTNGGRVLGITAKRSNLKTAITNTYKHIGGNGIHFSGMHYRHDIGKKGL